MIIDKFDGEYDFLSNFYHTPVIYEGISYRNSEAAFQSAKTEDMEIRRGFILLDGGQAERKGRTLKLRDGWDNIKIEIMYQCVKDKFSRNIDIKRKLINTGDALLIEGNYWHDTFWGECIGVGYNVLGIILTQIREEFKQEEEKKIRGE